MFSACFSLKLFVLHASQMLLLCIAFMILFITPPTDIQKCFLDSLFSRKFWLSLTHSLKGHKKMNIFFFFLFAVLENETRALCLLGKPPIFLLLLFLRLGVANFAWTSLKLVIFLLLSPEQLGIAGMSYHVWLQKRNFKEYDFLLLFLLKCWFGFLL
jgi:hypothetical protein